MPPAITLFQVDSLKLWKTICSSKLLENATFILFMNKSDILEKKLKAGVHFATRFPMTEGELGALDLGIRFVDYVEQYREQPNDFDHVSNCQFAVCLWTFLGAELVALADIRKILLAIHKECSPKKRPIHAHTTCATVRSFHHPLFCPN